MKIVSEQVKILLERMDLYPEEFVRPFESRRMSSKWDEVIYEGRFNRVEKFLIRRKFNKLLRKATQEVIMQTIMKDEEKQDESFQYRFNTVSRMMVTSKEAKDLILKNPRMRMKQK